MNLRSFRLAWGGRGGVVSPLYYAGDRLDGDQLSVTRGGVSTQRHVNPTPTLYVSESLAVKGTVNDHEVDSPVANRFVSFAHAQCRL